MDIVVEYFKFLYKIVWYIYMKLLEFYGLRKIILVVNITRLSIYFIWCDLLYFFLYAVMYQDEFKLYTTFWTNMHAYFFFWKRSTTCIHSILTTNETHLYSIHTYFLYYIFLTIQHTYILDRIGGFNSCEISNLSPNLQIDQRKMQPMCAPCVYAIVL